ncbi:TPA: hypothetical protein VDV13_003578 [Pseudomonas aeruginosa]|uniref:hypothetical protein n=1 Tax=Pseudomonas aeruginosa TaxID=287 RepID=UPI00053D77B3|nr:hypothetical protein [Pseudomonas aeruginosa]MCT2384458.1 hypothetical protein [Pseudomonas aeruginosa]MCV0105401.1 hypothetical protein [Pseudomonas aeruginosa]QOD45471.1 hypothetical protein HWH41_00720 [Pseudomonas aeruginosa]HBN9693171.1 hypothetical protein [Pseudomonas aeruginosa]HCE5973135.1 hypothetical protein [Pseudomonas aeruginosa]
MSQKIQCPECQGPLKVWLEIDATLSFAVSSSGKLNKRSIEDNMESDGRCGLECQGCDWKVHGADVEDKAHSKLIEAAYEQWEELELAVRTRK